MTTVAFTINGKPASVDADGDTPLLWVDAVEKGLRTLANNDSDDSMI